MVRRYVFVGLAVLWGIVGLSGAESWGAMMGDSGQARATLRGLSGVGVIIENLPDPEVERAGLTRQQLQTDVELQLRQAGITVLTWEETPKTPGAPSLYVRVNVWVHSDRPPFFNIDVELNQAVRLLTDDSFAIVSTWASSAVGSVGLDNLHTYIRYSLTFPIRDFSEHSCTFPADTP